MPLVVSYGLLHAKYRYMFSHGLYLLFSHLKLDGYNNDKTMWTLSILYIILTFQK